jgi:menaquinone-dependent protoporphyrinogen oxidase
MTKVLVVAASRHGGTWGIAERIGESLRRRGLDVMVTEPDKAPNLDTVDACVVGSGVYMGSWLREGTDFLERHQAALATRPVWLFSSGPLRGSSLEKPGQSLEEALGPEDGPGSGGRKRITALADAIHARENKIFFGAYDPTDPPKALSERLVRTLPMSKDILPPGDFRDWDSVEAWAADIAEALTPALAR